MRVLFSISILALIALLWATVAMVRHVQQTRRRQQRELQGDGSSQPKGRP